MLQLLSLADQALGRLDGVARTLPNPDLFVAMYVRREAVLSSQIEGTQSTLDDVLEFELERSRRRLPSDVTEVVNYVRAMNYGIDRLSTLPLSLRLIREIHGELLAGVRGSEHPVGEFRTSQNWIGAGVVPLSEARFVPPPPDTMLAALDNFEKFLHRDTQLPVLVDAGIAHAHFETIHPFIDGNGRVGRLLITLLLCQRGVLHRPLLYLSYYLKRHRAEYYDRLQAIRETGDWEGWIEFFLRAVGETATSAAATAREIVELREAHRDLLQHSGTSTNALALLDKMFERPIFDVTTMRDQIAVSFGTANNIVEQFAAAGLVEEVTGGLRNRIYRYSPYLALFEDEPAELDGAPIEVTGAVARG